MIGSRKARPMPFPAQETIACAHHIHLTLPKHIITVQCQWSHAHCNTSADALLRILKTRATHGHLLAAVSNYLYPRCGSSKPNVHGSTKCCASGYQVHPIENAARNAGKWRGEGLHTTLSQMISPHNFLFLQSEGRLLYAAR